VPSVSSPAAPARLVCIGYNRNTSHVKSWATQKKHKVGYFSSAVYVLLSLAFSSSSALTAYIKNAAISFYLPHLSHSAYSLSTDLRRSSCSGHFSYIQINCICSFCRLIKAARRHARAGTDMQPKVSLPRREIVITLLLGTWVEGEALL